MLVCLSSCITKKGVTVSATSTGRVIEPSRLVPTTNGIFKLEKPVKLQPIKPPIAKVVPIKPDSATAAPEKNPKEVTPEKIAVPLEKPKAATAQPTKPQYVLPKADIETNPETVAEPIDLEVSKLIQTNKAETTSFADLIYFYFSLVMFLLGLFVIYRLLRKKFLMN